MAASRLQITFRGVDEGSDPKSLPPGTLLRAENVRMDKARRLAKRYGTATLAGGTIDGTAEIVAGKRFILGGASPAVFDGNIAYAYSESYGKWQQLDRPPQWKVTRRPLVDSTRSLTAVDAAIYGTRLITFFTVYSTGCAYYQIDDLNTGTPIVGPTQVSALDCYYPRVLVSGTKAYFLYATANVVRYRALDLTTNAFTVAETSLCTGAHATAASNPFDATIGTPTAGVPTLYVGYVLAAGADRFKIESFTVSTMASITSLTVTSSGTAPGKIAIAFGTASQKVAAVYAMASATHLVSCTTALASQLGPVSVGGTGTPGVLVAEHTASNWLIGVTALTDYSLTTNLRAVSDLSVVAASVRKTFNFIDVSRPWRTNGRWYASGTMLVGAVSSGTLPAQASSVVVELETDTTTLSSDQDGPHAHAATLENYTGWFPFFWAQTTPVADANGVVWLPAAYRKREPGLDGVNLSPPHPIGWNIYRLEAAGGDTMRAAKLGPASLLAGGAPAWSDGVTLMSFGFAHSPQIANVSASANGSLTANSTYSYRATYAWVDAAGMLHRSAPSPPVTGSTASGQTLSVTVRTASLSGKQRALTAAESSNPVLVELWRTTANASTHYRLTYEPISYVLTNDARAASVTLADTAADTSIATNVRLDAQPVLYSELGELENIPPPSLITVTTHRGRLVGIGPDLRTVWFSKDWSVDQSLAPGFNEALTLTFSHDKTALASLDASLVVFGEDKIDLVNGDGPDDAGNGAWGVQSVHTDVGCVNPRSVVVSPLGVLFESRRGIELLDRGLSVGLVPGKDIGDTLASYPTITSAVLVAEESEVRFTCDNGSLSVVLVYDYLNKLWMTRKYTINDVAQRKIVDAALIDGVYTMLFANGMVAQEMPGKYLDGTTYVETDIVLAPISAQQGTVGWGGDNMAWQRVKDLTLMGTSAANHNLAVSFAHNYANTYSQTKTFTANSTVTAVGVRELARVTCAMQKCQSIQIRIRDLTPTGLANGIGNTSAGVTLESLCLRIAPKEGVTKTSSGQQA